jgi:hypothetical protein
MMLLYLFVWLVEDKHQPRRVTLFYRTPAMAEFLKRNEDALSIRVVGEEQTPTTACVTLFLSNTCYGGTNTNHGVLLYFYLRPAAAEFPVHFI